MDKFKSTLIAAFVIAVLFVPAAWAQPTAAKVDIIFGNGQLICPSCAGKLSTYFYPMVVKVTDASGNPIAGKTVNWQLVSATPGTQPDFDQVTFTDSKGISLAKLNQSTQSATLSSFYLQSVIRATVDSVFANFTETQALASGPPNNSQIVFTQLVTPIGTELTGPAGSIGTTPIQISVQGNGVGVPNVSMRLLNRDPQNPPTASCATGPGADPGSVLTDANGNATCNPVFGPVAGRGPITVLVGGLDPAQFDQSISPKPLTDAISFFEYFNQIQLNVTPVTPGRITVVSGNNQSVDPGRSSAPLVAQVTDLSGAVTIANTSVVWTVAPAGAATLSQSSTTTDSQGKTRTTVIFGPNAAGQITVRAGLTGSKDGISATFNLSTNVQIAALANVSGDLQTAQSGQNFALPLVVQVIGTNGQPLSNQQVSFLLSGNVTLSATSVLSDAAGRAQTTVKAGPTPGPVTISAFVGNISQAFTLTIIPPGPALSSSNFFSAGGVTRLGAVSPCSLVTVVTTGLAPNVQGLVFNVNAFGPWATTLASDTVTVNNVPAPLYNVGSVNGVEQLTFQVPCETAPGSSVPITINVAGGTATVNLPVQAATPGILETLMSDGVRRAVVIRPDGTFVSVQNPARRGEVVRAFAAGMGPAAPAVATGALPFAGVDSLVLGQVIVGVNNAGARVVTSRVAPNLIGVYEVAFQVPDDAPTGNDVVLSVAVNVPGDGQTRFSNGSKLPIQQ